jgi:hypothetical protein
VLNFYHDAYVVLVRPIYLRVFDAWQVRFYIARHAFPTSKTGKLFIFPDNFDSESLATNRSIDLAMAVIDGELPEHSIDDL